MCKLINFSGRLQGVGSGRVVVRGGAEGGGRDPWRRFIVFCLPLVGAAPAESAGNDKGRPNSARRVHAATQSVSAAAYTPAGLYPNTIFHFSCTPVPDFHLIY